MAVQLAGFLVEFLNIFHELRWKNFYLAGESYGKLSIKIGDIIVVFCGKSLTPNTMLSSRILRAVHCELSL